MLYITLELHPRVNEFINAYLTNLENNNISYTNQLKLLVFKDFLLLFQQVIKQVEDNKIILNNILLIIDFFNSYYYQQSTKYKDNLIINTYITNLQLLFNKYYTLTNYTPIYSTIILLYPSLYQKYLNKQQVALKEKKETKYIKLIVKKVQQQQQREYKAHRQQ